MRTGVRSLGSNCQLDEDRAARLRTGSMAARRRVANVSTGRIVAMFVLKHAAQYQELLVAAMRVR